MEIGEILFVYKLVSGLNFSEILIDLLNCSTEHLDRRYNANMHIFFINIYHFLLMSANMAHESEFAAA